MNSSLWSAGHTTHLKIVAVSLVASIVVVAIGTQCASRQRGLRRRREESNRGQGRQGQDLYRQRRRHNSLNVVSGVFPVALLPLGAVPQFSN